MTKKIIWVIMITQSGEPDYVAVHATYEAANEEAREALKEAWEDFEMAGDMPADQDDVIAALQASDCYTHATVSITHYTIETDALADA